jgi:hypothetical protein
MLPNITVNDVELVFDPALDGWVGVEHIHCPLCKAVIWTYIPGASNIAATRSFPYDADASYKVTIGTNVFYWFGYKHQRCKEIFLTTPPLT